MEYYTAMKISKLLLHALIWTNHINIMLRKRKQTQISIYIKFKNKTNHTYCSISQDSDYLWAKWYLENVQQWEGECNCEIDNSTFFSPHRVLIFMCLAYFTKCRISFFLNAEQYSLVFICPFFIHSPVSGHLMFPYISFVNSAAINVDLLEILTSSIQINNQNWDHQII